ncbi:MAG: CCA tRNA nucleotidyltransferase [Chloroflexi bacterium]|nr:CCA tRNA nucleotidyltransferase [Chloroflexota bacterium]
MANVGPFLEKNFPPEAVAVLREAGRLAAEEHAAGADAAYVVGGLVRDLMLGIALKDVDISVTADGPQFADALVAILGGAVVSRSEFGTAVVEIDGLHVDVAMTRRESYIRPGALPIVAPGSLKDDLARRDFTINAMAVDITPARWGELTDPHGGQRDIVMRKIRILHEASFADDPTRALRALRYETRLGFSLDPGTHEQMERDAHYLGNVSPARIVAELERLLDEPSHSKMLQLADERGLLGAIHPGLRLSKAPLEAIARSDMRRGEDSRLFDIALIATALTESEADSLASYLSPPSDWGDVIRAGPGFRALVPVLERQDLQPSEVVELLEPFPEFALKAQLALAPPTLRRDRLRSYLNDYQHVQPDSTGDDLLRLGVPEGPLVGKLLSELRTGRLNRTLSSRFEEEAHVKRRLPLLKGRGDG